MTVAACIAWYFSGILGSLAVAKLLLVWRGRL